MAEGESKKEMPFIAKALIVAILSIVVVVVSTGVAYFVASSAIKKNLIENGEDVPDKKKDKEKQEEDTGIKIGQLEDFGEFTINLNEVEPRYLVCKIQLELDIDTASKDKKVKAEAATAIADIQDPAKKIVLQDKIITILKSKSIADLNADPALAALRAEIMSELSKMLPSAKIKNVYFGSWIIQ